MITENGQLSIPVWNLSPVAIPWRLLRRHLTASLVGEERTISIGYGQECANIFSIDQEEEPLLEEVEDILESLTYGSQLLLAECERVRRVLRDKISCFSRSKGCTSIVEHRIETGEGLPIANRLRRLAPIEREEICLQVQQMLDDDIVGTFGKPVELSSGPCEKKTCDASVLCGLSSVEFDREEKQLPTTSTR